MRRTVEGLAVAHIQVPEVGFNGDTTVGGWKAAGWVRAANSVADHWIVQAILYRASGVSVVQMPVDAAGNGSLQLPAGTTRVVTVVSPTAPLTTVSSSYTLTASA